MNRSPASPAPVPYGAARPSHAQRRLVGALALVGTALQLLLLSVDAGEGDRLQTVMGVVGSFITAFVWWRRTVFTLNDFYRWGVGILLLRCLTDLAQDVLERVSTSTLTLFEVQIVGTVFLAILPVPRAIPLIGGVYSLVVVSSFLSGAPNIPNLAMLALSLGMTGFATVYGRHVVQEQARSRYLQGQLTWDTVTGTLSRHALSEQLETLMRRADRSAHLLLLVDLDHFKAVNDRFGHLIGDQALRVVAVAMRSVTREGDLMGRWGGEEFVLVLSDVGNDEAERLSEQLLHTVRTLRVEQLPALTVSAGAAWLSEADSVLEALQIADTRLYVAKHSGRDRVVLPWDRAPTQVPAPEPVS